MTDELKESIILACGGPERPPGLLHDPSSWEGFSRLLARMWLATGAPEAREAYDS